MFPQNSTWSLRNASLKTTTGRFERNLDTINDNNNISYNKKLEQQQRKVSSGGEQSVGTMSIRNCQLFLFLASLCLISCSEAFAATTFSPSNTYNHKNLVNKIQRGGSLSASTEIKGDNSAEADNGRRPNISIKKGFGVTRSQLKKNGIEDGGQNDDAELNCHYIAETNLPTDVGNFRLRAYRIDDINDKNINKFNGNEPCVIYCADKPPFGDSSNELGLNKEVPVRIHDQCVTSEVFGSKRCDCKEQLVMALSYIKEHGGAIIYLQQEGRGIGIANKIAAYALQDKGYDTVDANLHLGFPEDARQYGVVPSILANMGIESIKVITNNPRKVDRLKAVGVNVVDTLPMVVERANIHNRKYLQTKKDRMNHKNFGGMLSLETQNGDRDLDVLVAGAVTTLKYKHNGDVAGSIAEQYINDGEEMAAHAITSALSLAESQEGVKASADGYCFGRKSVEDAIAAVARGEIVVVVDDMDRENEGDFIMAADLATPETIATIIRYSSGVICIGMEGKTMDELQLVPMVINNQDPKETAFSVTVDASEEHGITTGISAVDRAKTMQLLAEPSSKATDFVRPGHIFPLRAREGGVLTRDGHTEVAVDLSRLAGRHPSGVLCEIVSEENPVEMARLPELIRFCKKHGFVLTSIVDVAQYRRDTEGDSNGQ